MNDEQMIWENYVDSILLNESLDKIEFYPYEKTFSFYDTYNRANEYTILEKKVRATFQNKSGDTIAVMVSFTPDDYPVLVINFLKMAEGGYSDPSTFEFTQSGDAVNVIATVMRIGIEAYRDFRSVMMYKYPRKWSRYLTVHEGTVGVFKGLETAQEKESMETEAPANNGKQQKRARVYKIVFDRLIKQLSNEFKLPEMYLETRNEFMTHIKTTEKATGKWAKAQQIPVVGKLF